MPYNLHLAYSSEKLQNHGVLPTLGGDFHPNFRLE